MLKPLEGDSRFWSRLKATADAETYLKATVEAEAT
jgi:hypothetical protein